MSNTSSRTELAKVRKYIQTRRPGAAVKSLRDMVSAMHLWQHMPRIEAIESGYRYMVEYMLNNGKDPGRETFINTMIYDLLTLADIVERDLISRDATEIYFAHVRTNSYSPGNLAAIVTEYISLNDSSENQKDKERLLINYFNYIWTTFPLSPGELHMLADVASEETHPIALRTQTISALLLGGMQYYERGRILALLDICDNSASIDIKAKAIIALVLTLYTQSERALSDVVLKERLDKWIDSDENRKRLSIVILDIIRTLDTERINKTLRDEFIPAVNKLKPSIDKLFKNGGLQADGELNPEWEELMTSSGLDKKLRDLTELQAEGADLMMFAFSNLKNYGFFQEVSNWFLPFDIHHSTFTTLPEDFTPSMLAILDTPGMMCDSDKFSFALSLMRTPDAQRRMMFSQLHAQEENIKEALAEAQLKITDTDRIFRMESERYIRNLNRFFKLFREHGQFRDVLLHPFSVTDIPVLGEAVLSDSEQLKVISEFYLRRGYYDDALEMLRKLQAIDGSDSSIMEKTGYCLEQKGDFAEALAEYRKAELFNPDSLWLLKHIASTARQTRRFSDGEEYYGRVLEHEPENTNALMNRANCLVELGKHDEALKLYYQIHYLKPGHLNAIRAIAWEEFIVGNSEKSIEYHEKVIESGEAMTSDYINAGHAHLAVSDFKTAIDLYIKGVKTEENATDGIKTFSRILSNDRDAMIEAGCNPTEIDIVADYVITSTATK